MAQKRAEPQKQPEPQLPADIEVEKLVLGSVLLNGDRFAEVVTLTEDEFSIQRHKRIFGCMRRLAERAEKIDHATVASDMQREKELWPDGLSYLVDMDRNLPVLPNIDAYIAILREKSALRRLMAIGQNLFSRAAESTVAAETITAEVLTSLSDIRTGREDGELRTYETVVRSYEGGVNAFINRRRNQSGIRTGFARFDEMTGGMKKGEVIVLGAQTGAGKTALACNIIWNVSVGQNIPAAFFSLEMDEEQISDRLLCSAARVDSYKKRYGRMDEEERHLIRDSLTQLMDSPLFVDPSGTVTLPSIRAKVRRMKPQAGLVVVDYLQLLSSVGKFENRNIEITHMMRGFKIWAKDEGIPVVILSQLSRDPKGAVRKPELSDLRESGSIEHNSDLVAFIYRECLQKRNRTEDDNKAELIIRKQRNGITGTIPMIFTGAYTRFEETDRFMSGEAEVTE